MYSTVEVLDGMDGTAFERLCGPVLRKMIPELADLLPSGINADGRVVKSLADGFCFVNRNHYATAHYTTNASDLKTKWLYNGTARTTPKGDLIKSIVQAREMHALHPAYKFSIFLVSSRRVNDALHLEVNKAISDDFIAVRIIEQRDLVLFLDHNAEGQYLRQKFLDIDADRISPSLLIDIVKENLFRYGQEIYLEEIHLTNISGQKKVEAQLATSTTSVNLLIGDSGFGKSTLCFAIMRSVIENGGIALRIKPSMIEKAVSIEDAILQQVKSDYQKLYIQVNDIKTLFQNGLIVIDDINKPDNTGALLDKIISWSCLKKTGVISVLCPVWPRNLDGLDNKIQKEQKFTTVALERLSFNDCKAIIQQRTANGLNNLTEQNIHALIFSTGFDPLLLDFSLQLLVEIKHYTENITNNAIKRFVDDKIQQIHKLHHFPVYLINQSLILLGNNMLRDRKLDPHLRDLEKWFGQGSQEYRIILMVAAERQLFSFDDEGNCFFRHDRVRDFLLTLSAANLLEDFVANEDALGDPYYAEITGAALSFTTVEKHTLEALMKSNPLAVYFSLKFLQGTSAESRQVDVIEEIEAWKASTETKKIPLSITKAIVNALMSFDVKQIDKITQGLSNSAELQLARFRNGIWLSGVNFFSFIDYFYPEAPTYWWNSILSHVKAKYLDETIEGLRLFLPERFTPDGIVHAYTLVGFLREARLLDALIISWRKYASPQNYPVYLWAFLNSFTKDDRQTLREALSYWSAIPEEGKRLRPPNKGFSARAIKEQLRVLNWNFSEEQQAVLIEISSESALQEICSLLFARVDHPVALAVVLNEEMKRDNDDMFQYDNWDSRWDRSKRRRRLSDASLEFLLQEFSNTIENSTRRYLAWRYWTGNVDTDIAMQQLRRITDENDTLFNHSLIWRIKHHDLTAFPAFQRYVTRKPWMMRLLAYIWNEEVCLFFENWFLQKLQNSLDDKDYIKPELETLELLDNEDACRILCSYWEYIKRHPGAIGTALFLSTPATRALAEMEIRRLGYDPNQPMDDYYYGNICGLYISDRGCLSKEKEADLLLLSENFKYLHWHYPTNYKGEKERLTKEKLESLIPYLTLLDSFSIYEFSNASLRIGAVDLCYEKFYPLLETHLKERFRLTAEAIKRDIISKFRKAEKGDKVYSSHWIEEADKLGVTNEMLIEALQSFSENYHNANAFFVISPILERLGTRKSLNLLSRFVADFEEDKMKLEYWKANAVFSIKRRSLY